MRHLLDRRAPEAVHFQMFLGRAVFHASPFSERLGSYVRLKYPNKSRSSRAIKGGFSGYGQISDFRYNGESPERKEDYESGRKREKYLKSGCGKEFLKTKSTEAGVVYLTVDKYSGLSPEGGYYISPVCRQAGFQAEEEK